MGHWPFLKPMPQNHIFRTYWFIALINGLILVNITFSVSLISEWGWWSERREWWWPASQVQIVAGTKMWLRRDEDMTLTWLIHDFPSSPQCLLIMFRNGNFHDHGDNVKKDYYQLKVTKTSKCAPRVGHPKGVSLWPLSGLLITIHLASPWSGNLPRDNLISRISLKGI
jgi:hypothetical protein